MLDPIGDSWEARISSVRMSSKNLFGENAEKCKKVSKNQCTNGGKNDTLFARESIRSKAKKGCISGRAHRTKIHDFVHSEEEWARVNKSVQKWVHGPWFRA